MENMKAKNKVSRILWAVGFCLCVLCAVYMVYLITLRSAVTKLQTSGEKTATIGGIAAVAEGEVVSAEDGETIIRYYHEWDGTDYQKVLFHASSDYQAGMKVPVAYSIGMGAGSCLLVGFYRNFMSAAGMAGIFLVLLGIAANLKKKGME